MNNLNQLWKKRFNQLMKEVGKYSRLIFNDHFSIILLFILGFGAFYYREQLLRLEAMDPSSIRLPLILIILGIQAATFYIGRPIWFTQDPDKSYLFARGKEWRSYWLKGTGLSLVLPVILNGVVAVIVTPLLTLATAWQIDQLIPFILIVITLKICSQFDLYLNAFRQSNQLHNIWMHLGVFILTMAVSYLLPQPWHLWVPIAVLIILAGYLYMEYKKSQQQAIQFNEVLEAEALRESRFYKWISIFADVPKLKPSFKRRAYLDGLIETLSRKLGDRYSFLYIRSLFRNNAYSGIWFRVMLFIAALLLFVPNAWFAGILGVIGFILTIVQLVPLMNYYRGNPYQQLYPNRQTQPLKPFQTVIAVILFIQLLVFALAALIALPWNLNLLLIIVAWLAAILLLVSLYVPFWYRKHGQTF
ncbi:ABC transporter permease [Fundicoccus culcitae]|uniref:ABC transporter permease n=1 Tax=Fundicoccus culcitae TaxID=2969821 RepID=A0ABY5P4N6_9LACT|nr:ABC transporter permease [Fundicoccus culcitae]UUX33707.1 ABC transporter permease [Fundicoccus culcitae]